MSGFSREQLLSFRREDLRPPRAVRKTIFRNRLWLPITKRRHTASCISPEGISDVTSSDRVNKQKHNGGGESKLKFGLLNARSVGNKYATICGEIVDNAIGACLLTETWHSTANDTALRRCVPPRHALYESARKSDESRQNHGGVAAIVSSDFKYRPITATVTPTTFESMAFTISASGSSSSVAVLLIYRPGSSKVTKTFFDELTIYLEAMALYKCQLVVAGDLNIHVEDEEDGNAKQLLDLLQSFDCTQRVVGQMQVHGGTLDHVFTRSDEVIADMNVRPPGVISDHSLITWTLPFTHQPPIAKRKSVQSWKRVDRDQLRQYIIESDLCTANTSDISAEMMFRTYDRVLREISNKLAPPRETIVRVQPIAVWYNDESRLLRRRSRALERKYRKTGLASDRILWVQQEKTRHKANRVKENAYWLGQISEHSGRPRKLWKAFSSIMGLDRVTSTSIGSPSAQDLLEYFVQKIETIRKATGGTPATTKLSPSVNIFSIFEIFSTEDVRKLIMSTKSKPCSLDPIPTEILKELLPELLPFITDMCNKSMQEGCLPASQKHAIISPIIKKAGMDAEDVKSYRPISNLTYMSKLIERMVYRQITTYLEANHLLPKFQSGFRARHSTETAVLKVLSNIFTATDQGSIGLLGLLDMSAAFDRVDHEILLLRLESTYGISGTALAWLRSFLSGRTQQVVFNGGQSLLNTVTTGVPQGSVLGPLLFLLYTADIPLIAGQFGLGVHCYADDG